MYVTSKRPIYGHTRTTNLVARLADAIHLTDLDALRFWRA